MFIQPSDLRAYLATQLSTGRYSDATLSSNIRAASSFLERESARQFEAETGTKTFTTHGRAQFLIPDLRSATSVTKDGSVLDPGSYYLLPDRYSTTVYTAIQFRVFQPSPGGPWWLHDSQWFDKGLDIGGGGSWASLPNDLVIVGEWGWADLPAELMHATKILSAYYTLRPDSVLSGVSVSNDGTFRDYRELPPEVQTFMRDWQLGQQMVAV